MKFKIDHEEEVVIRKATVTIESKIGEKQSTVRRRTIMLKGTLELILGREGVKFSSLSWQPMTHARIHYRFTIKVPGGTRKGLERFIKEEAKKLGIET